MKYQVGIVAVLSALLVTFLIIDNQGVRAEQEKLAEQAAQSLHTEAPVLSTEVRLSEDSKNKDEKVDFSVMSDNRFKRLVNHTHAVFSDSVYLDNIKSLRQSSAQILNERQSSQAQNDIKLQLIGYFSSANGAAVVCSNKDCLALVKFADFKAANKQGDHEFCHQLLDTTAITKCSKFNLTNKTTYIFSLALGDGLYQGEAPFKLNAMEPYLTAESGKLEAAVRQFAQQQILSVEASQQGEAANGLKMFVKSNVCKGKQCIITIGNAEYVSEALFKKMRLGQLEGVIELDLSEYCWRTLSGNQYSQYQYYYDVKWECEY